MPSDERHDVGGKHAVVTGGGRGIGLAIATLLAERGARVSVVSRSADPQTGDRSFATRADVTVEAQVVEAFDRCRERNGPIEILINNSGVAESASLLRTSVAMWQRVLATNLTGTFLCTREAAKDMVAARWGRIVSVASVAGLGGAPYISAYSASKHGVVGFTRSIAAEFAGSGITANAVCPGYTETDMFRRAVENVMRFTGASEDAARERLAATNPGGRIATLEEVAAGVLDLIAGSRTGVALVIPAETAT